MVHIFFSALTDQLVLHVTRFLVEICYINIFVLSALQIWLQIRILHKILICFKKKFIENEAFFAILQHFSGLVACALKETNTPSFIRHIHNNKLIQIKQLIQNQ